MSDFSTQEFQLLERKVVINCLANASKVERLQRVLQREDLGREVEATPLVAACAQAAVLGHLGIAHEAPNLTVTPTLTEAKVSPDATFWEPTGEVTDVGNNSNWNARLTEQLIVDLGLADQATLPEFLVHLFDTIKLAVFAKTRNEHLSEETANLVLVQFERRLQKLRRSIGHDGTRLADAFKNATGHSDLVAFIVSRAVHYRWKDVFRKILKIEPQQSTDMADLPDRRTSPAGQHVQLSELRQLCMEYILSTQVERREASIAKIVDEFDSPKASQKWFHLHGDYVKPDTMLRRMNTAMERMRKHIEEKGYSAPLRLARQSSE